MDLDDEDPVAPEGFAIMEECPAVGNHREMLKRRILFRWDCGWCAGILMRRHTKSGYNYFVRYEEEDGTFSQYRQNLIASNYYNEEDNPDGVWVLLKRVEPNDSS